MGAAFVGAMIRKATDNVEKVANRKRTALIIELSIHDDMTLDPCETGRT